MKLCVHQADALCKEYQAAEVKIASGGVSAAAKNEAQINDSLPRRLPQI